jgi:hypothetical protein
VEADVDVVAQRLRNSRLYGSPLTRADEVVRWLGAVQAQEWRHAWWSVGMRAPGLTEADVVAAFDAGALVRTHVLRPTWHLVAADDLRWLQRVTAPRVHVANRSRYAQLGLDEQTRERGTAAIAEALRGGTHHTRQELRSVVEAAGIDLDGHAEPGQRLAYIVMHAELEAVVCSGPLRGKQHTYALVDERVPAAPPRPRDDDLGELATRYLRGRGPATAADLAWWSGLTIAESTRALDLADAPVIDEIDGRRRYAFAPLEVATVASGPIAHLLQPFDEVFIGLRDRRAFHDQDRLITAPPAGVYDNGVVAVDGRAVGGWRRTFGPRSVRVEVQLLARLDAVERAAVRVAAERYATFLGLDLDLDVTRP